MSDNSNDVVKAGFVFRKMFYCRTGLAESEEDEVDAKFTEICC